MQRFLECNREKFVFAAVATGLFLVLRFVVPLMYPFVIGGLLAAFLYPVVRFLHRKTKIGKGIWMLALLTCLFLLLFAVLGLGGYGIVEKGYALFGEYEKYLVVVEEKAGFCCDWLESRLHLERGYLMDTVKGTLEEVTGEWTKKVIPSIFRVSFTGMKTVFSVGAFVIFVFLSAVLFVKEWEESSGGIFSCFGKYVHKVVDFLKIFLGAQLKIISVIVVICVIGFWVSGIENAFGLAVLTAAMDVLPLVGTGIIIVPMLLWKVVNAQYYPAFLLLATYICCMIAREYLEPKFISDKTGISPVFILLSIYAGVQIMGFAGIFLGPLYVLLLQICYEEIVVQKAFCAERE
ncbi:MAG: AI-2E family transporter [Lachnospiraceae bacterium]|nr:AI-2E family transporter [Lachnospiraceae bacterium]